MKVKEFIDSVYWILKSLLPVHSCAHIKDRNLYLQYKVVTLGYGHDPAPCTKLCPYKIQPACISLPPVQVIIVEWQAKLYLFTSKFLLVFIWLTVQLHSLTIKLNGVLLPVDQYLNSP